MAEIAAGFVGPAIDVVKWVGTPILRQFKYLWYFTTNITNLKKEAEKLQDKEQDLQQKVQAGEDNGQVISNVAKSWLRDSKEIKDEKNGIIDEFPNVKGGCLKLRARISLSKRAKNTADRLKELQDQYCKFSNNSIFLPGPAPAKKPDPSAATSHNFESRKKIEQNIMKTLRDGDVNMMGICGMGGLGKTTMAKRIMNRVREEHLFDEVVMAVVSQEIDKLKIQDEIGGSLGLKLDGECSEARLQKLHARLSGSEARVQKRILLVLDDVWERFGPEDLGIPSGHKECTILLTSRNRDVLRAMNVEPIFGMEELSKEDSWFLFKEKAGTCVVDTKLTSIAKKVVNECRGLPIALITVGSALKDQVEMYAWTNALRQLQRRDPDIQGFIPQVYNPLKLSYDVLERKYQDVFLLCCLYPEDADIPLERLTYFCMGLRIFKGGMVEERDRMHSLTDVLKDRSLLLDSNKGDDYVRMHDVVRDVCIYIANKHEGYIDDNDLTSSSQRYKFRSRFELLQIRDSDEEINCEGINRDLHVLSIERCSQLTSLPFTQRPNNLITLVLDSCEGLVTLSVVGELVNLEILICRRCGSIEELPPEIKGLNRLKVLDLTKCRNLKRIGRGIISSLVGLEELKMLESFQKWEIEDREESENAGLGELVVLNKLRCLEIEVLDISDCEKMEAVFLWKGEDGNENNSCHPITKSFPKLKEVRLYQLPNLISLCQGIEFIEFPLLRKLDVIRCRKMKGMVSNGMGSNENNWGGSSSNASIHGLFCPQQVSFGCLKSLTTERNPFCSHTIDHVYLFNGLERLTITKCAGSQSLFSSSMVGNLVNLEELEIEDCDEMEEVIKDDEEKGMSGGRQRAPLLFPKLHMISLSKLSKLVSFCELKCDVDFPSLREVEIDNCPNMKNFTLGSLAAPNFESFKTDLNNYFLQVILFISPKKLWIQGNEKPLNCYQIHGSVFDRLEVLKIDGYKGSMSLFSSSITGNLVNLTTLIIFQCFEMVKVIEEKEEEKEKVVSGAQRTTILFPKLQTIDLRRLFELVRFCEWKCEVELPSLMEVVIYGCDNMKSFTLGPLNTPKLESVMIHGEEFGSVKDLNGLVQQQYINRTEKKQAEEAEKKKGGEEEHERKGETEEEQN